MPNEKAYFLKRSIRFVFIISILVSQSVCWGTSSSILPSTLNLRLSHQVKLGLGDTKTTDDGEVYCYGYSVDGLLQGTSELKLKKLTHDGEHFYYAGQSEKIWSGEHKGRRFAFQLRAMYLPETDERLDLFVTVYDFAGEEMVAGSYVSLKGQVLKPVMIPNFGNTHFKLTGYIPNPYPFVPAGVCPAASLNFEFQ